MRDIAFDLDDLPDFHSTCDQIRKARLRTRDMLEAAPKIRLHALRTRPPRHPHPVQQPPYQPVPKRVQMSASELLQFAKRTIGGRQYNAVEAATYQLTQLMVVTNIRGEETTHTEQFGKAQGTRHRGCSPTVARSSFSATRDSKSRLM